ncbi:MAG TPA: HNH endonuclease family protein [Amycolatopsis sp.]|nr:HNH endonuclease family protein [Amycolatopsis sp.]
MTRTTATAAALLTAAALTTGITGCRITATTATATPAAVNAHQVLDQLAALQLAPEDTGNHYDRDQDWPHWDRATAAGRGCDIRDQVLQQQGHDVTTSTDGKCHVSGTWTSPYDNTTVTKTSGLQIDHVVPLKEANRSGVRGWSTTDRERFANDTRFLLAVSIRTNEQKGDQDPARWMPPNTGYRCTYVALWVQAKTAYRLTVDQAEHDALAAILGKC